MKYIMLLFAVFLAGRASAMNDNPDYLTLKAVFKNILREHQLPKAAATRVLLQNWGYDMKDPDNRDPYVRLRGAKGSKLGTYALNTKRLAESINLQMPHGDTDLHTRKIGQLLCEEFDFRTCSTNTVSRRVFDMAHESESGFSMLTEALIEQDPQAMIVQLHGFEGQKRSGEREKKARMIISAGENAAVVAAALRALRLDQDNSLLVYGLGTRDLGATTNAQGRRMRALGQGQFLHIEMSLNERERLVRDRTERALLNSIIREIKKNYHDASTVSLKSPDGKKCRDPRGDLRPC